MSSAVAGKPVNITWYQPQQQQQQQQLVSSSSVTVTHASGLQVADKDVLVELNTDVNNDDEDDAIVVDSDQQASQASCSQYWRHLMLT